MTISIRIARICRKKWGVVTLGYFIFPTTAHAYLDPGTGSLLFSAILGIVSTIYFWGKTVAFKFVHYFSMLSGKTTNNKGEVADFIFYSEGAQYWSTFKPLIDALANSDIDVAYWSSDQSDAGLAYSSPRYSARYIGKANRAYSRLNLMEAKVCVSTTPGLDVLQIKRSKGVGHYAHVVHAPTTGTYKLYSFDYFDSVLCSGQHQIDAIRELESKRGTLTKQLFNTGCTYMDVLARQLEDSGGSGDEDAKANSTTILIAPSWGENGLLNQFGSHLIATLLDNQFKVIIRPHPQSLIVESELVAEIKDELKGHNNVTWDLNPIGFDSLEAADIMLSDFSGIVFDCAFIFEKPVITIDFDVNLKGLDANDLDHGLWELGMLDAIGKKIAVEEVVNLPTIVRDLISDQGFSARVRELRASSVFNFSLAGEVGAQQLLSIINQ